MDASFLSTSLVGATWLGIVASLSPCPLATNVAAMAYMARFARSRSAQIAGVCAYGVGRALAYVVVASLLAAGLAGAPGLSGLLQRVLPPFLGPLLLLVGMVLTGLLAPGFSLNMVTAGLQARYAHRGPLGAAILGFLFALSFCPVSAALFFGSLIPLALASGHQFAAPVFFGIGSSSPVLVLGLALALGQSWVKPALDKLGASERGLTLGTGVVLILVGIYLCAQVLLGG